jgi:WD40-like Beta Propeller Repeat
MPCWRLKTALNLHAEVYRMPNSSSADSNLIPRRLLFGNASRLNPRLSPDGSQLAWLAPVDGVMNIWIASLQDIGSACALTRTKGRPIFWQMWTADGRYLMFLNDINGDENEHLFAADTETGELRDLTPIDGISTNILCLSRDLPDRIVVGLNDRDARWHDAWSIDRKRASRPTLTAVHADLAV